MQIQRTISNESNKSFELDIGALQESGFLDSVTGPLDEVYHSEIKEPDFEILKSFEEATNRPVTATNEIPEYNVSRSQLPALSIFDTMSLSSSREERSSSAREKLPSGVNQGQQPSDTVAERPIAANVIGGHPIRDDTEGRQPREAPSQNAHVTTCTTSKATTSHDNNLPALSIFNTMSSTSHSSKEERQPSIPKAEAASCFAMAPQPVRSSRVVERKETSPVKQRVETSPRPTARVITGRQGPPRELQTRDSPPSGQTTISSIEVQERRRILDFEDLYTARQEGQLVGIGARNKVSSFASPAFDPNARQKKSGVSGEREDTQRRQRPGLVLVAAETNNREAHKPLTSTPANEQRSGRVMVSAEANHTEAYKPVTSNEGKANDQAAMGSTNAQNWKPTVASPPTDVKKTRLIGSPTANDQRSGHVLVPAEANHKQAYRPLPSPPANERKTHVQAATGSTNGQQSQKPTVASPPTLAMRTRPVMSPAVNEHKVVNSKPGNSPNKPRRPIYEAVICRKADGEEPPPPPLPEELEESKVFYKKQDRARKITPPYHVLEEFSRTYPRQTHSQGDSSNTLPRDGNALDPNDTIGRSLSEPAYGHNGRPISPWERQSSSNSQRSLEVEQEYRSLVEGK